MSAVRRIAVQQPGIHLAGLQSIEKLFFNIDRINDRLASAAKTATARVQEPPISATLKTAVTTAPARKAAPENAPKQILQRGSKPAAEAVDLKEYMDPAAVQSEELRQLWLSKMQFQPQRGDLDPLRTSQAQWTPVNKSNHTVVLLAFIVFCLSTAYSILSLPQLISAPHQIAKAPVVGHKH